MATLAANSPRQFDLSYPRPINDIPVIADDVIYEGAFVGESSSAGTARPLQGGDVFLGVALRKAYNAGGSAGDVDVLVATSGVIGPIAVVDLNSIDNLGDKVYATDDDTLDLGSTGGTLIGKVLRVVDASAGTAMVLFEAPVHDVAT